MDDRGGLFAPLRGHCVFSGSHQLTIDDKGRLAIPACFRKELASSCASQLLITRGPKPCLEIYPRHEFDRLAADIDAMEDREHADLLMEEFIGSAAEAEIDKQGRVLLPPLLRRNARLEGAAVLMGQLRRFDLWPEDVWVTRFSEPDVERSARVTAAFRTLRR